MQRWSLVNAAELSPQVCGKLAAQKKKKLIGENFSLHFSIVIQF